MMFDGLSGSWRLMEEYKLECPAKDWYPESRASPGVFRVLEWADVSKGTTPNVDN
jgi:hypothetical protein